MGKKKVLQSEIALEKFTKNTKFFIFLKSHEIFNQTSFPIFGNRFEKKSFFKKNIILSLALVSAEKYTQNTFFSLFFDQSILNFWK